VLLRSESAASSQIENLTASARAIAEAELPRDKAKLNAEMIVANTAAMQAAVALSHAVDTEIGGDLLDRHTVITVAGDPHDIVAELAGIRPLPKSRCGQVTN
jgi:hypothetical protein